MKAKLLADSDSFLEGRVIHGEGRGKKIGFPTANIDVLSTNLESGVYGVRININGSDYYGVMNIGIKPTFHALYKKTIEVYIINFDQTIYGLLVKVEALFKIRNEQKFESVHELISQIKLDIETAINRMK